MSMNEIKITLTFKELKDIVCNNRIPLWLEHRFLCHPERECEDGCDAQAIMAHVHEYQDGQGSDPAYGGEAKKEYGEYTLGGRGRCDYHDCG